METTLREIVLAIPALSKLAAAPLRLRSAYRLQKLTSALQKEADFFAEQRQKILSAYGEAYSSGEYHFSAEQEQEAVSKLEELLDMAVSPACERLTLPLSEELCISVNEMGTLTPFVAFTEEEENCK